MIRTEIIGQPEYFIRSNFFWVSRRCAGRLTEFGISRKLGLWPGGKGLGLKKHRPGEPFSQGLHSTSAEGGGPEGDPPDRPSADSNQEDGSGAVPAQPMK